MRMRRNNGDEGAALILALIFITVVGMVVSVSLSFADSSLRTTVGLRTQAAGEYESAGGAQAAINLLRKGSFGNEPGADCFGGSNTLNLNNFYRTSNGATDSVAVDCAVDESSGAAGPVGPINNYNKPMNAILTLDANVNNVGIGGFIVGQQSLKVQGPIFSNSKISVDSLNTNDAVHARGTCQGTIISVPAPVCSYAADDTRGLDPHYAPEPGDSALRTLPVVPKTGPVVFEPGRYTDITGLNAMMRNSGCEGCVFWFKPGTYYFDFPVGSHPWTLDTGYLIGGTPKVALTSSPPNIPGSCVSPLASTSAVGVQFIFAGDSQFHLGGGSGEICASYHQRTPPIVFYGLTATTNGVPGESGCVITLTCSVFSTDQKPNDLLYIQGTLYAPLADVSVSFNNATESVFKFGIVARTLQVPKLTGSVKFDGPFIEIPENTPGYPPTPTVVLLSVYDCPGASTCSAATGTLRLRSKVAIEDPSGAAVPGARLITVRSWSMQR